MYPQLDSKQLMEFNGYLFGSFYINSSVFSDIDTVTWKLEATHIDSTIYPLLTLFELLQITPYQKVTIH